jgi:hypothetical protein
MYINLSPKPLALPCALWKLQLDGYGKTFCLQAKFCQKSKLNKKIKRFWWVSITKSEGNSQNHQIPIVGFQCVAINIGGYFKNYTSYLVYSQLLLNFRKDDHHFRKTFRLVITT